MKMCMIVFCLVATLASSVSAEQLRVLTPEERAFLVKNPSKMTAAERKRRQELAEWRNIIDDGGPMCYPGTPLGCVKVANLQKRVPAADIEKVRNAFMGMMEYDIRFVSKDEDGTISIKVVDRPGAHALTVWPDESKAEVNVAALATDNPKPQFLAARARKEIIRAFGCMTAGSTYGHPLFRKLRKGVKSLDDIASEDFPLDVIFRGTRFLDDAGMKPIQHSTYREVVEAGYDVAPTNGYQKAIYEEVKKTTPLTRKVR